MFFYNIEKFILIYLSYKYYYYYYLKQKFLKSKIIKKIKK